MNAEDLQMSYVFGPKLVSQPPSTKTSEAAGGQDDMVCGGSRIRIAYKNRKENVKDYYANSEGGGRPRIK